MPSERHRLFHALVLRGASLTGTAVAGVVGAVALSTTALVACGNDSTYAAIYPGRDTGILPTRSDSGTTEGGDATIMEANAPDTGQPDGYGTIKSPPPDSGATDSGEAGDAPVDAASDCYPCIAPAGDA